MAATNPAVAGSSPPATPDNAGTLVEKYVRLRDALKVADDIHSGKTKAARELLVTINNQLLDALHKSGSESVKTASGTAYLTQKKSATIADGEVFRSFVTDNHAFELVDMKANAVAVKEYLDEHRCLPPGVNYTSVFAVNVRRA